MIALTGLLAPTRQRRAFGVRPLLACATLATAMSAGAQQHAHEHGVADLRVAIDGSTLLIEFESPLDNLVGFEHAPRDEAQFEALHRLGYVLRGHEGLFGLPQAANCVLTDLQIESPYSLHHGHDHEHGHDHPSEHGHHEHHDHGNTASQQPDQAEARSEAHDHGHDHKHAEMHDHDHDHKHEDKHDRTHDHGHAAGGAHAHHAGAESAQGHDHADLYAVYQFECEAPAALDRIDVNLGEAFLRIQTIRAATASQRGQSAVRLDRQARELKL